MSDKYILDARGEPVICRDLMAWARWFEANDDRRVVAQDTVGVVMVSTVFLGLDHAWGHGRPLLWETMIFGGAHDRYQERYASRAEAVAGHARALALANSPTVGPGDAVTTARDPQGASGPPGC